MQESQKFPGILEVCASGQADLLKWVCDEWMVKPAPLQAEYNILMERMEADFFRAGLHHYMYLDPVVCCPLSHQEILGIEIL